MKNILKIKNQNDDTRETGPESSIGFDDKYPGLFNFYVNPGSDGSFISSYWSQVDDEYLFVFGDGDSNAVYIDFSGDQDGEEDFEFNEEITTQINQALWTNPGGGVVDITDLPVFEKYEMRAEYIGNTSV
jgi:hypothetical protein